MAFRIVSVEYTEYGGQTYAWTIKGLSLIDINLIVGKNATGKSRVLRVISGLSRLIEGQLSPRSISSGNYRVVLRDMHLGKNPPKPDIVYATEIHESKVLSESLEVGGVFKLKRQKEGRGKIFFEREGIDIDVQIPDDQLAATARRDSQQHGFFEQLHEWARSTQYYECARTEVNEYSAFEGKIDLHAVPHAPLQGQLHLIVKVGKERFGHEFISSVTNDMTKIGYQITDFGLIPAKGVSSPIQARGSMLTLYVIEAGIDKKLAQNEISDGMLRALSTLIYLHFIRLQKNFGCFLIDDIGEGLDFDRSTKLIAVVIEQAIKGKLQLVMTTNDRFVMNGVPLKYWSVMKREKGVVQVFNQRNSAETFSEFEQFGFNNFDFFSKQFFSSSIPVKQI